MNDRRSRLCYSKKNIMNKCVEYFGELFKDRERPESPKDKSIERENEPPIFMIEMEAVVEEMSKGKATGDDGGVTEMNEISVLLDSVNKKSWISILFVDSTRSIFISFPKRDKYTSNKDHGIINLMAHVIKVSQNN